MRRIISFSLSLLIVYSPYSAALPRPQDMACQYELSGTHSLPDLRPIEAKVEEDLNELLREADLLPTRPPWTDSVRKYLIPSLQSSNQNLVVTIAGSTNVGKSLIFNSLPLLYTRQLEEPRPNLPSFVSFNANSTARPVLMFSADLFDEHGNFDLRFPRTERWKSVEQVGEPGFPLVYTVKDFFKHIIFVDTPAFSTAPSDQPHDSVDLVTRSDILIYIFSNTNYSDQSYLESLRQTFQRVGPRDLILIYNVDSGISAKAIEDHIETVNHALHPLVWSSESENNSIRVLGSYHMVHSDRVAASGENVNLIPVADSMPFVDLLSILDSNFFFQRRQALNLTLKHVLERAKFTFSEIERTESELDLTERILLCYLDYLIAETTKHIPYDRFAVELEDTWNRQSGGLSGFAHWVANPLKMSGITSRFTARNADAVGDIERNLENIADTIVADFRLAIAEEVVKIPKDDPIAQEMIVAVDQFRTEFDVQGKTPPDYKITDDTLEVHLPIASPNLKLYLDDYAQRKWPESINQIKQASKESFANLALEIQTKLGDLVRQQSVGRRAAQAMYTTLTLTAVIAAITYIAYQKMSVVEMQSLAALLAAHLLARFFVSLEKRSLDRSWQNLITNWFAERQHPRLREILATHVRFRPSSQKLGFDFKSIDRAVDQLEANGIVLKEAPE